MAADRSPSSYLRRAFLNVYNLSLVGGAATVAALGHNYVAGALAFGVEALWLVFGPDLAPFRRYVDRQARDERIKTENQQRQKTTNSLPEREWARAKALDTLRNDIERDMQQNPSFQAMLLQVELDKLDQLQSSFVNLASACVRAETYLSSADVKELQRQTDAQHRLEETLSDPQARELARKNAQVLEKRQAMLQDIRNFLARGRGQMTLIENSVRLLRDQVLTMASPDQLGDQLDDLLNGIEAVSSSAKEQDLVLARLESEPATAAVAAPVSAPAAVDVAPDVPQRERS